jgi:hypothetical protein
MHSKLFAAGAVLGAAFFGAMLAQPAYARKSPGTPRAVPSKVCDRDCLYGFLDEYLKALLAKDPSHLPLATAVKSTENDVAMAVGDGLWNTVTELGPNDVRFADVQSGQAGCLGVVRETQTSSPFALRLKIKDGKIAEVEIVVARPQSAASGSPDLDHYVDKPVLREILPADQRSSREKMVSLVDGYFDTLQRNDGTLHTEFDDNCNREENGVRSTNNPGLKIFPVTNLGCADQFRMGYFRYDDRVRDRRYPLVDEERGLVLAAMFIDHSAKLKTYKMTDGRVLESAMKTPNTLCILELFKIRSGKLLQIQAVMTTVPYNMPPVWAGR